MKKMFVVMLLAIISVYALSALKITPRPNPWNYQTSLAGGMTFPLASGTTEAILKIFNLSGDLVYQHSANSTELTTGIVWDGKNNHGFLVATGVYFFSMSVTYTATGGSTTEYASGKILFVR